MDILELMKGRHSVRQYTDRKIEGEVLASLQREIEECNALSGLNFSLCTDEPVAFGGFAARYGGFKNVQNYIVLAGKRCKDFEEKCGYYGERIVLKAAELGLNTCWVGISYRRGAGKAKIAKGEKLSLVIAIGYGVNNGHSHKVKPLEKLFSADQTPEWFINGMLGAQCAPTAINQQRFLFTLKDNSVKAKALPGFYSKVDLGIAKYHFEQAANAKCTDWTWG